MEKQAIQARLKKIQQLKEKLNRLGEAPRFSESVKQRPNSHFKQGISVIVPTYKGEQVILTCLQSLAQQTIPRDLFEVIVIINGEKDSTEEKIKQFTEETGMGNILVFVLAKASASLARNVGIENATRNYSLFLDDDDYLSENFLKEMFNMAREDSVVVSQIVDVDENGNLDHNNPINQQVIAAAKEAYSKLSSLDKIATINACKLIPTRCLKGIKYNPALKSGEDVVFFVELFLKCELTICVIPIEKQVIYYRLLRQNSVSRQAMTFEFYIKERLAVIKRLDQFLQQTEDHLKRAFVKQKINAQALFINRYLKENREQRQAVVGEISKQKLSYNPYPFIFRGLATQLMISYCFPPYVDTSGTVMAKRIRERNEMVDVVYNQMDQVRDQDVEVNTLVDDLIEARVEIPSPSSFANWQAIEEFCTLGLEKISGTKQYNEIYSRAMWPGSHFLAYQYKLLHPKVKWTAEFSDPLLFDIHSKKREAKIDNPAFIKQANQFIKKRFHLPAVKETSLFFWCEYLPYLFADELIFTNENQLNYMLENFPLPSITEEVVRKAVVSPHPTLHWEFYQLKKSDYRLDETKVNLAYFGAFYQTRNLSELFVALEKTAKNVRENILLHVFTSNPMELADELRGRVIEENIKVNPYVGYLEFLHLTTLFDCLVVNDASTKQSKSINPYLPSKLSDYLGSGTKIWGIYEENSIMSHYSLPYKSPLGDVKQAARVLEQMVSDKNSK